MLYIDLPARRSLYSILSVKGSVGLKHPHVDGAPHQCLIRDSRSGRMSPCRTFYVFVWFGHSSRHGIRTWRCLVLGKFDLKV